MGRLKTGGRTRYLGKCTKCSSNETSRWYHKAILGQVLCKSCYDKNNRKDPIFKKRRDQQRKDWAIKYPYKDAKRSAKAKGYKFNLSEDEYLNRISKGCYFCGMDISNHVGIRLDRIDNEPFYSIENTLPCCKICNVAKNQRNVEEFTEWVRIVSHRLK